MKEEVLQVCASSSLWPLGPLPSPGTSRGFLEYHLLKAASIYDWALNKVSVLGFLSFSLCLSCQHGGPGKGHLCFTTVGCSGFS
jgi:hypothetical protein